jgi:UDP-N-acetylglucosamine---dolichyl-phosphate N-acetylglucosaminyltransferase
MKTLVVVPAYNEGATIASVLTSIRGSYDVVVIDDGSTDATATIAAQCGAAVLQHCVNRGLGAALRTGFRYACDAGYEVVVTLDADGQHDPDEIPRLLDAIHVGAAVVIGRRDSVQMPTIRQLYNAVGAALTSGLFGGPLRDSQSGFRALRTKVLRDFDLKTSRMEISSEILAECHRLQLAVAEVPITVRYTEYSMSKGQSLFEGARTAWRLVLKSFL